MSGARSRIEVGDLVQVVRMHCPQAEECLHYGTVLQVLRLKLSTSTICTYCKTMLDAPLTVLFWNTVKGNEHRCYPVAWVKKIEPLSIPEAKLVAVQALQDKLPRVPGVDINAAKFRRTKS